MNYIDTISSLDVCKYPGGLYLVATPLGNLKDITLRALDILTVADVVACEDTRTSRPLLDHYGIKTPVASYHDHSSKVGTDRLSAVLLSGGRVAVISDAGTPLISDPGYPLVRFAIDHGIDVYGIPGPCAAILALTVSGFSTNQFFFGGFLPSKPAARRQKITAYGAIPGILIFYESPHRLLDMLGDVQGTLGNRFVVLAREMTKKFEEIERGHLTDLMARYTTKNPRGEYVVLIDQDKDNVEEGGDHRDLLTLFLKKGDSVKDAVKKVVMRTGLSKKQVYDDALILIKHLDGVHEKLL